MRALPIIVLASVARAALAQPISVVNHSFEANAVDSGCFDAFGPPSGWSLYDPFGIVSQGNFFGVLDPGPSPYFLAGQVPDGEQVALLFFSGSVGQGELGLTQQLGVQLEGGRVYRLSVGVGNIASGASPVPPCSNGDFFNLDGFPGYAVQLVAGGVVIGEDRNTLFGMIPEGEFRESVVEVNIPADHAQVGAGLEIRLINLNEDDPTSPQPGIEVDFDDVRLEALDAPCAADWDGSGGQPNSSDFLAYLNDFSMQDPAADLAPPEGDGGFDSSDFLAFLNLYAQGC
ncbi:MAG: GC-type dockerin domain-anchored protein [Phycisphaerales bacterium]|jgi:hypothetical protein|nr:GC-type dockerin domain-anchored protein [Phycisphaerales bacterium]